MKKVEEEERVLIIGAGAAGLLIAQVLKKQGIPCVVFEQDSTPHSRPRDWNYGIYWAQSNLSECLPQELVDRLPTVQVDSHSPSENDTLPMYNGATGELLNEAPTPYCLRLQRRKFLKLIATDIDIRYKKRLSEIESEDGVVTATFEDGTHEQGKMLIGSEGAHSRVREYLLGPERAKLISSPIVASATVTHLPEQVALSIRHLHPRYCIAFHPEGYFTWLGIHNETGQPGDWEFMVLQSWVSESETGLEGEAVLDHLKGRGDVFKEPFRTVLQSIPSTAKTWHNRLSYWPTRPWDNRNGTVTLAGDAAHPMTFHRGQGLNNAILDAASIGREVAALKTKSLDSLPEAIAAYEKDVWNRGNEAVTSSNINSMSIHDWEQLRNSPLFKIGLKQKSST